MSVDMTEKVIGALLGVGAGLIFLGATLLVFGKGKSVKAGFFIVLVALAFIISGALIAFVGAC